jgi:hypothetical protein
MWRWLMAAMLLTGCGQTVGAAVAPIDAAPTFAMGPATVNGQPATPAAPDAPDAPLEARRPSSPQDGVWKLRYRLGDGPERHDELSLSFAPDGRVDLVGDMEAFTDFPYQWNEGQVTFEGLPRRDLLGGSGVSRDRVAMTLESPTRMRGTISLRVNFRWIAVPATAEFVRADDRSAAVAVTPGTITDTTEPEAFLD